MSLELRYRGPLNELSADDLRALTDRQVTPNASVRAAAAEIVAQVRAEGDAALRRLALQHDGVTLKALEIPRVAWREALAALPAELRQALQRGARNITTAHRAFMPQPVQIETEPGVLVGRRPDPFRRVGVYAPGGRAVYPSSVLMGAIPARVAGVEEVILCTPPGPGGQPSPVVLAAAELADVDRVFAVGGAGAIAAMAYGTATIPSVDCIVGPGNAWVAEAKLLVSGQSVIDSPAGPSELLVIADHSADPGRVASEMIAQAEHDPGACVITVVLGAGKGEEIELALKGMLTGDSFREPTVRQALGTAGGILRAYTLREAVVFAEAYAPEHLMLALADPASALPWVRNAGTVFLGSRTSVASGDYLTGANHVLPTGGAARRYSGLSTETFVRWTTWQDTIPAAARELAGDVAVMARAEGLPGHAAAALSCLGAPQ